MKYVLLSIAIISEVVATSALKSTEGFTRLRPSLIVVAGYMLAFYCLSQTLRSIPIGIAYAIWSGAGVGLVATIGWLRYGQRLDTAGVIGLVLIVAGVVVLNVFSKTTTH